MTITGAYKKDANFTTIYTEDTLYTIARNTGEWSLELHTEILKPTGVTPAGFFDTYFREVA